MVSGKLFDDPAKDWVVTAVDDPPPNESTGPAEIVPPLPPPPPPPPPVGLLLPVLVFPLPPPEFALLLCEWCCEPPTAPPTAPPMMTRIAMRIAVMPHRVRYHGDFLRAAASPPFSSCPCLRARATAPGLYPSAGARGRCSEGRLSGGVGPLRSRPSSSRSTL